MGGSGFHHQLPAILFLAGIRLIELHGTDGQIWWMNTEEISALRQPNAADLKHYFTQGTHCIVTATNGKIVAAIESCAEISKLLSDPEPPTR